MNYQSPDPKLLRAIRRDWQQEERAARWRGIKECLKQQGRHTFCDLPGIHLFLYAVKAAICLALGWQRDLRQASCGEDYVDGIAVWEDGSMPSPYGPIRFMSEVRVGRGIWNNWHFDISEDSD